MVERSALQFPTNGATKANATGKFTLHGQTKDRKFSYTATPDAGGIKVSGKLKVNILEHGIAKPEEYGVKIEPDVDVEVTFQVKDG